MKTLNNLKRDLKVGAIIERLYNKVGKIKNPIGIITKIQSNGLYIDKNFLDYPMASLLEYDGEYITIYEVGSRQLTEKEKAIIKNAPSNRPENKQQAINEMLTDGSGLYWKDKAYYKENDALWYYGQSKGLRYSHNDGGKMYDNKIKGDVSLKYRIRKEAAI